VPELVVERLEVMYPADDDNVYFLGDEHGLDRVQIDTWPGGRPLFLVEAEDRFEERSRRWFPAAFRPPALAS
jgi:hypothetical protein